MARYENKDELWDAYATWVLLPVETRKASGAPVTKAEYAEKTGIPEKTLENWRSHKDFKDLLVVKKKQMQARGNADIPGYTPVDTPEASGPVSLDGLAQSALAHLDAQVRSGDRNAISEALKLVGKQMVSQMMSDEYQDLQRKTDAELAAELLDLATDDMLVSTLVARGWECVKSDV